jgi:hypothetical protein
MKRRDPKNRKQERSAAAKPARPWPEVVSPGSGHPDLTPERVADATAGSTPPWPRPGPTSRFASRRRRAASANRACRSRPSCPTGSFDSEISRLSAARRNGVVTEVFPRVLEDSAIGTAWVGLMLKDGGQGRRDGHGRWARRPAVSGRPRSPLGGVLFVPDELHARTGEDDSMSKVRPESALPDRAKDPVLDGAVHVLAFDRQTPIPQH